MGGDQGQPHGEGNLGVQTRKSEGASTVGEDAKSVKPG